MRFLVRCLQASLRAEGISQESPPEACADWKVFIELAAFHRVVPLLRRALLKVYPQAAPPAVRDEVSCRLRSIQSRSLFLTGELMRLIGELESHGIPAIPLKGPALAYLLYDDPGMRDFDDLDILVRTQDFSKAKRLLISGGYQSRFHFTVRQEKAVMKNHEQLVRNSEGARIVVELHRDMMPEDLPLCLDHVGIWERREPLSVCSANLTTVSPEDLLLFLCVHGSKHLWFRLQWLCDVAQLIRRYPSLDWGSVKERADVAGCRRMLLLGLLLVNDILGVPLPCAIDQEARRDPPVAELTAQLRMLLFESPGLFQPDKRSDIFPLQLKLADLTSERLLYLLRHWLKCLISPTPKDWESLPLPDALFPMYYVLRPLRLAYKSGQRAVRGFLERQ